LSPFFEFELESLVRTMYSVIDGNKTRNWVVGFCEHEHVLSCHLNNAVQMTPWNSTKVT
jgi:hypothetical protein